jgi:hypothetical protein
MTPVNTCKLTPRYGARRRPASISSTSTAAEVTKTSERARNLGRTALLGAEL